MGGWDFEVCVGGEGWDGGREMKESSLSPLLSLLCADLFFVSIYYFLENGGSQDRAGGSDCSKKMGGESP